MNVNSLARIRLCCCLAAVFAIGSSLIAFADDPVFSGPQVGEKLTPFEVISVDGESAGTKVDPIKLADGGPTLLVFVHKLTRPGVALTRAITGYAVSQKSKGVRSGIVWLDDDKAAAEAYLTRAAGSLNFVVPVGVSVDGGEGPGAYGLNRNVELTILVADENTVKANFALVQPSVTEAAKIASELAKVIGQPEPNQEQLERAAYPQQMMRRRAMTKPAQAGQEGKSEPNELRDMLKGMIARDATEGSVRKSIESIEAWVGDQPRRKSQLAKMATAILDRGMGTPLVQPQLKTWQQLSSTDRSEKQSQ